MVDGAGTIHTVTGSFNPFGCSNSDGPVASATLGDVRDLRITASGEIYLSVGNNCPVSNGNLIRRISDGGVRTIAGNGTSSSTGDNGPASLATLSDPVGLDLSPSGDLYVAERAGNRIRQLTPLSDGGVSISTFAGNGTTSEVGLPWNIVRDSSGNIYFGSVDWNYIIEAKTDGTLVQVASSDSNNHTLSPNGTLATAAYIGPPGALYFDAQDRLNFFIGSLISPYQYPSRSKRISSTPGGAIESTLGSFANTTALQSFFYRPTGVALGPPGELFLADQDHHQVYEVNLTTGAVSLMAGVGECFGGVVDGAPATTAFLCRPNSVWYDATRGVLYVSDANLVWGVDSLGFIRVVAGGGDIPCSGGVPTSPPPDAGSGYNCIGDGYYANQSVIAAPAGLVTDATGSYLYIAETGGNRVRRVDLTTQFITTLAGATNGSSGSTGNGGPAAAALLNGPQGLALAPNNELLIADTGNSAIRQVSLDAGQITALNVVGGVSSPVGPDHRGRVRRAALCA
jgi:sugar lactone lactonase YvrE